MKIAVTGANGYVGSHVVKKLCDLGCDVIAVSLHNTNIDSRSTFLKCDILDTKTENMYKKLLEPDACLHLAWQDGFNHYSDSHIKNLTAHFEFVKNIIDNGCKSIIVMGSAHEIGYHEGKVTQATPCNPLSYYGIAKNTLRQLLFTYIKDKKVILKWLRAYYIYGDDKYNHSVFTKLIEAVEKGDKTFPFTKGTNQFDFIDIDELSLQISLAILDEYTVGIINVCSGYPTAIKDIIEDFIKSNNYDIQLEYGKFPSRQYDSPVIYGDNTKIKQIMRKFGINK